MREMRIILGELGIVLARPEEGDDQASARDAEERISHGGPP